MADEWVFLKRFDGTVTAEITGGGYSNEMPEEVAKVDAAHRLANGMLLIADAINNVASAIEALASAQGSQSRDPG